MTDLKTVTYKGESFVVIDTIANGSVSIINPKYVVMYEEAGLDGSSPLKTVDAWELTYIIDGATGETVGYIEVPVTELM